MTESARGRMQALGMNWTYLKQYRDVDDELRAFDAVTLDKVREVLERYPLTRFTTLVISTGAARPCSWRCRGRTRQTWPRMRCFAR